MSFLEPTGFKLIEVNPDKWHKFKHAVRKEDFQNMDDSELWAQAYDMLSESDTLNEGRMNRASHFVFQTMEDDLVGFGSIKPNGSGPQGNGVELYQMIVHPDHRRKGYGTEMFEKQIEVAEKIADNRDVDNLYAQVAKVPNSHYSRINNENQTSGYQDIIDIAEEEGLKEESVFRSNPMMEILEDEGFETYNEEIWKTDYHTTFDELM